MRRIRPSVSASVSAVERLDLLSLLRPTITPNHLPPPPTLRMSPKILLITVEQSPLTCQAELLAGDLICSIRLFRGVGRIPRRR